MPTPPQRVRIAKLQETQIDRVVSIDLACKEQMSRTGVLPTDAPPRTLAAMAKLTKGHNVLVAEADGVVAGYAAWRDESPGVAYLEDIAVAPELQRLGVGGKLLEEVRVQAKRLSLPVLLTRCWGGAKAGKAFLAKSGFAPLSADAGERAELWQEEQGAALAKEGQAVLVQSLV